MSASNALDSIDGGAGTDTLAIAVTGDVTALKGTIKGIETVTATATSGNVGTVEAAPAVAVAQVKTITLEDKTSGTSATYAATDILTVTFGSATATVDMTGVSTAAGAATAIASTIDTFMDAAYGASTTHSTASGAVITVTSHTAGVALPTISVSGTKSDLTAINYKFTSNKSGSGYVNNVVASDYVAASTFAVPSSATTATLTADKQINASAAATTDVTATATTTATITGGKDVKVISTGGATVKSAAGAVTITEKGTAGSAVVVEGGTTVSVTKYGAASTGGTAYSGNITVGADASFGATSVSSDGYPQIDANVAKQPTGNVTINNSRAYTDDYGQAQKVYGSGTATVYTNGATNVSVATGGAITIKDVQVATRKASVDATAVKGTQNLASATIEGTSGAATITSDSLTSLKVVNTTGTASVTVTNATAAGHALSLTVGNAGTSGTSNSTDTYSGTGDVVIVDNTATSVTVTTEAQSISTLANASASYIDINAAKATSLVFNNTHAVTLTGAGGGVGTLNDTTKVTKITLTGSGATTLGTIADATKLSVIDASAATGALKVNLPATSDVGITVTGGAGNDVVTLDGNTASITSTSGVGVTTTISLGAGNDSVVKGSSGVIGAGSSVNGGDGTDTISASLLNAGNSSLVTGFEILGLDLTTGSYDTNLLVGATGLELLAQGATAYTNVEQAQGLAVNKDVGTASTTLTFTATDVAGSADSYTVTFGAKGASDSTALARTSIDAGTIVIEGIENAVIVSNQASGYVNNTIDLTSAKLKTVTVSGNAAETTLGLLGTNGTNTSSSAGGGLKLIDATAATGIVNISLATATINIDSVATVGFTVKTGAAADSINLQTNTSTKVGVFATVDAGAGADTITVSTSGGKLTGGAGADSFNVADAVATAATEAGAVLTTITDLAAKDKVKLLSTATAFTGTKVALTTSTLEGAIGEATTVANAVTWFQYGGDTYIVSNDGTTGFGIGDLVVKVTGLVTLTNSTLDTTTDYLTIV